MKIGFLGSQSTGKTTILNELHKELPLYEKCAESTRWVKSLGFDINEQGNDLTQQLILMKHLENLCLYDNMITDRTLVDGFVYTKWLSEQGKVSVGMVQKTYDAMCKMISSYDLLFYLPIEFDIQDDGVRSLNNQFRLEIDQEFKIVVDDFNIPVLSGTVNQRLNTIRKFIKEKH